MAVASGKTALSQVNENANCLQRSGRMDWGLQFLQNLTGTPKNFHRQIERMFKGDLPPKYPLKLTVKGGATMTVYATCAFDVLRCLHKHPQQFQASLLGNYDKCVIAQYWEHMRGTSWQQCNVLRDDLWERRAFLFPTVWHSDAGNVYNDIDYLVYHWSTPFTYDMDPKDARLYCFSIEDDLVTPKTEAEITTFIVWQQGVLESGIIPALNHLQEPISEPWASQAGQSLASGYGASFSAWTGDLKARPHQIATQSLRRGRGCLSF